METEAEETIKAEATDVEDFSHTIVGASIKGSIKGVFIKGTQTMSPMVVVISLITTQIPKIPNLLQTLLLASHAKSATNLDTQPLIAING